MTSALNILFIEDDLQLASLISRFLESNGFICRHIARGDTPIEQLLLEKPDLILLDIMLPGKDGLTLCRDLRRSYQGPIVLLTALDSELNEIMGLETGANDYVVKTTPPTVLLARIRAQLRQVRPNAAPANEQERLNVGPLSIDRRNRNVSLHQEALQLTTSEFELLWALARRAGEIVTRDELSIALRGLPFDGLDRTVDITLSRLRRKLGDDAEAPTRIKTIRTKGYLLALDAWGQDN